MNKKNKIKLNRFKSRINESNLFLTNCIKLSTFFVCVACKIVRQLHKPENSVSRYGDNRKLPFLVLVALVGETREKWTVKLMLGIKNIVFPFAFAKLNLSGNLSN